jgi:hypothetical protein
MSVVRGRTKVIPSSSGPLTPSFSPPTSSSRYRLPPPLLGTALGKRLPPTPGSANALSRYDMIGYVEIPILVTLLLAYAVEKDWIAVEKQLGHWLTWGTRYKCPAPRFLLAASSSRISTRSCIWGTQDNYIAQFGCASHAGRSEMNEANALFESSCCFSVW